jgi:hypothetical protein
LPIITLLLDSDVVSGAKACATVVTLQHFVGIQASVDAVRYDDLTRCEGELLVVEEDVDDVWLALLLEGKCRRDHAGLS